MSGFDYADLEAMSVYELDQLIAVIVMRIKEEKWKETAKRLEAEAADAILALREFTGRNYMLTLGCVAVVPKVEKRAPRFRMAA